MRSRSGAPIQDRILDHVVVVEDCWEWTGTMAAGGYGHLQIGGRGKMVKAHRASYEAFVGPIPAGMELDHLCRNRRCVKPAHLEVVDRHTNVIRGYGPAGIHARKTHCVNGHEFTEANTLIGASANGRPRRSCRTCAAVADKARRPRRQK